MKTSADCVAIEARFDTAPLTVVTATSSPAQRTEKLAESVARQILRDIQDKRLRAGTTLPPESAMLERFDIGRSSLREALRTLDVNGLVTLKPGPGGGPVVAAHDPRNFGQMSTLHLQSIGATYRQLLDARVEYETVLARKAAEQEGDAASEMVRAAMDAEGHRSTEDQLYSTATSGFHRAVAVASGNPVIGLAAESIYAIWSVRVTAVLYPPEDREQVSIEHEQITRAIEKHDARRAERLMREHMLAYQEFCELRYPARMDDIVDWK